MKTAPMLLVGLAALIVGTGVSAGDKTKEKSPREALQAFNDQIGSWRGTGTPVGTREEQQKGFWTETMSWEWQFKGNDAWIKIDVAKGKHFLDGTLRYVPAKDHFELVMHTLNKETRTYTGTMQNRVLTVECTQGGQSDRLVFTLLHANRFLYRREIRKGDAAAFTKLYQVGATKEGVPFASGDGKPECIVSGGAGTTPVMYKGQTYYVCCSGCRDEFNSNPQKYITEYEAKKKAKK
jgi:hypothetical protein